MKFRWLVLAFLSIFFAENTARLFALDRAQWKEVYSGNPSSPQATTYIFLCTKIGENVRLGDRDGKPEGCSTKLARDCCNSDSCCDCCGKDESVLFLSAVTVDESFREFSGFSKATRGLIWSASIDFEKVSAGCCSYETIPIFQTAYNMAHYAPEAVSSPYINGHRDEFQLVNQFGEYRLVDKRQEYLHYKRANNAVHTLIDVPADYRGSGGVLYILRRALFRWKCSEVLTIGRFLELVGKMGEIDSESGYLIVPKTHGFLTKGYSCVEFCESFLNRSELVKERTGRFLGHKREDLLKHILSSEKLSGFQIVAHNVDDFINPLEDSYCAFQLRSSVEKPACNMVMFRDEGMPVFLLSDLE